MCPTTSKLLTNNRLTGGNDNCDSELRDFGPILSDNHEAMASKNAYSEHGKITCESEDTLDITITDRLNT